MGRIESETVMDRVRNKLGRDREGNQTFESSRF